MKAPTTHVLGGVEATLVIAGVTLRRALRSRATIGATCLAILPVVVAQSLRASHTDNITLLFSVAMACAIVIVGLVAAGPIGEEFEERTMTYLWSRPLPRWSVIAGKLVGLVPLAAVLFAGGVGLAFASAPGGDALVVRAATAATLGTVAMAALAAAIATLVPRHALALTIAYLFVIDLPLALIPARLQVGTIAQHQLALAGIKGDESPTSAAIGLVAIAAVWLAVALWRVRRIE